MDSTFTGFGYEGEVCGVLLFVGMLVALTLGQRIARQRASLKVDGDSSAGESAMSGAVFGLLGLLLAFTFSGAATRFEGRRELIVTEANAIGTAYLRLDLVKPDARARLQDEFRRYVDARLATYAGDTLAAIRSNHARAMALQNQIWSEAVTATAESGPPTAQLLLPALNDMIDITTTRTVALENHPPGIIYAMLIVLTLLATLLAGIGLSTVNPNWPVRLAFVATMSLTIFITLDIEYPRLGLIRINGADHIIADVRATMK